MVKIVVNGLALETVRPPEVGSIWNDRLPITESGKDKKTLWISVKDCLPKNLEKVLFVWVMDNSMVNIASGYHVDGLWDIYLPYASFKLAAGCIQITHWMPLPETPRNLLDKTKYPFVNNIEHDPKEFAKQFCEKNKDLMNRLADK